MIQIGTQTDTYLEQHPVGSVYYEGDKRYYTAEDGNVYELEHFEYVDKGEVLVDQDYADSLTSEQQDTGGVDEDKLDELIQGDERAKWRKGMNLSTDIDPVLLGMFGGKGQALRKGVSWLGNKIFASPALKANQLAKGGKVGQRIEPGTISKNVAGTGLKPSTKNKTADRYKSMSDRVKAKNATNVAGGVTAATILGTGINRGLQGNRNEQGDFVTADDETDNSNDEYDYYGNRRAVTKIMNNPDGFLQRQMRKKSTSGKTEQFGQDDTGRIIKVAPKTMGNQYGWHKEPGQNFWDVNDDDPYWDTHVMGTGGAWSDADVKEEVQEIDWSGWKNLFKGEG